MTKGKRISFFAAAFLLVAVASAVLGAYFGYSHARSYFGSQWLGEQCLDIRSRLVLLSYLKSSDPAKTAEMLEDQMYDDVISLEPDRFIDRRAKDNINQTLAEVRAYRSANPNTRRPMIDRMVEKALSLSPY